MAQRSTRDETRRWTTPLVFALAGCGSPLAETRRLVPVAEHVIVPPKLEADVVTERTTKESGAGIFLSNDEPEMTATDEAFAALDSVAPGTWRPR